MRYLFCFLLFAVPLMASAQDFEAREFHREGDILPYRILYPENYDPHKHYPLILFMHGAGERGNDNFSQLKHGSQLFLRDSIRKKYPAIVVFPQCPLNNTWATLSVERDVPRDSTGRPDYSRIKFLPDNKPTVPSKLLHQLMDSLVASGSVDTRRIYVGGLSMGGMGTFDILARFPKRFAAAFPICGAGNEQKTSRYAKTTALWIFHGTDDKIVPPTSSRLFYKRLQREGADVRYSEYPGVGHNSWENAFAEPELLHWLFSHRLKN